MELLYKLLVQLPGLVATACLFISYQQKEKSKLLIFKLAADIAWTVHYIMLAAYGGMIPNAVGIIRETVSLKRNKESKNKFFWPMLFIVINWIFAVILWQSAWSVLPLIGSTLVTVAMFIKNIKKAKLVLIPVHILFFTYNIIVNSYIGAINETVSLISIIIYFIKSKNNSNQHTAR